jgi:hypothetical protein
MQTDVNDYAARMRKSRAFLGRMVAMSADAAPFTTNDCITRINSSSKGAAIPIWSYVESGRSKWRCHDHQGDDQHAFA